MNAVSAASVSSSALRGCVTTVVNDTNLSTFQVLAWYALVMVVNLETMIPDLFHCQGHPL